MTSTRMILALVLMAANAAMAQEKIVFESHGTRQAVDGYFFKCTAENCKSALVMTPTCAGTVDASGALNPGYQAMGNNGSQRLNVFVIDHFSSRGRRQDCGTATSMKVSENDRLNDVLGAYEMLAKRNDIDPSRIAYTGFGGASPILALQKNVLKKLNGRPGFAAAVAFYPICNELPYRLYDAYAPLLILHGEADNWNPIRTCRSLAEQQSTAPQTGKVELVGYPGAHHAFTILNTPPGNWPGTNFTVGSDPAARADAFMRSREFIDRALATGAASKN
ncbi:dienelactone hydrolase family protein [Polaromonas sp.]|uniref:dienelactone hydrolase family protein n=1 Tax=Polaromonas sp. TaxID=1869339 RepID=UPI003750ABFD